nr:MtnX-like HAD-IB family phosphatase [candidate division Zixibacteria bacterium]
MTDKKQAIFCDFDGTFASRDVGYRLFKHFSDGKNDEIVAAWKAMKISSRECLLEEARMVRASESEIKSFLDQFELRPGAAEFYHEVTRRNIPFYIVSDGIDLYLDYILEKNGLGKIKRFCNHGIVKDSRLRLEFPYDNHGCPRCGCCKGARIGDIIGPNPSIWQVIFIGDGLSDLCALPRSNLIFARGDLLDYCQANSISAIEYQNFFDIMNYLKMSG